MCQKMCSSSLNAHVKNLSCLISALLLIISCPAIDYFMPYYQLFYALLLIILCPTIVEIFQLQK